VVGILACGPVGHDETRRDETALRVSLTLAVDEKRSMNLCMFSKHSVKTCVSYMGLLITWECMRWN